MANKKLVKHFVRVDTNLPQQNPKVTVMRASNVPDVAQFEFPICVMAEQLTVQASMNLAQMIATRLNVE